ncbi:MAG TPA: hypothetical protein RMH99_30865 [Sandaracinaceae bacterium LLY-WYZ-13_1]|nr:hypothetical protein [Sandaracinaceae bacterium LLY-WYZ-13_1]
MDDAELERRLLAATRRSEGARFEVLFPLWFVGFAFLGGVVLALGLGRGDGEIAGLGGGIIAVGFAIASWTLVHLYRARNPEKAPFFATLSDHPERIATLAVFDQHHHLVVKVGEGRRAMWAYLTTDAGKTYRVRIEADLAEPLVKRVQRDAPHAVAEGPVRLDVMHRA